jgi:hypothetical protein
MTPDQYVDTYHKLSIDDTRLGLTGTVKIERYVSGWAQEDVTAATNLLHAVALKCCRLKRGNADLPPTFTIRYDSRVDQNEEFYCAGIRRAFCGRGSPAEIKNAIRLAVLAGFTTPGTAAAYGAKTFGQDCNAFVANYQGVSPMIGIRRYALGSTSEDGPGRDLTDCRKLLPLPVRESPWTIAPGDVIISYGGEPPHKDKGYWRHIALVQGLMVSGTERTEGKASVRDARIGLTEWGTSGAANHSVPNAPIQLITDVLGWAPKDPGMELARRALAKEMPGRKLVGFRGQFKGMPVIRFFLDASSLDYVAHRGLHIANKRLGH